MANWRNGHQNVTCNQVLMRHCEKLRHQSDSLHFWQFGLLRMIEIVKRLHLQSHLLRKFITKQKVEYGVF